MQIFKLPDLGEGLTEAEIVAWHVQAGDEIRLDQPLLSVETAKAIVDIPSPCTGRVHHLFGKPGDLVHIGDPLVEFAGQAPERPEAGTVVGQVPPAQEVPREHPSTLAAGSAGLRVTPAVRALAHRLDVDLATVTPTGPEGMITATDVQRVAKVLAEAGPLEPLRGVRRAMAQTMARAHAEVVGVTIADDADIDGWPPATDTTLRLIRALAVACRAEPALNAWYDRHALGRRLLKKIELGIAVDTPDGLFVPVLRDVGNRTPEHLRQGLENLKQALRARSIPPEELRGYTITLSNFGTFGGRYADPIVIPPTVAILGAGRIRAAAVAVDGRPVVHRILPLSLSFDHRAVTGGEAARFLSVVINDLEGRD